jgi:hypothetical protein
MLSVDRAVDNIFVNFEACGFKPIKHNRCFLRAIVKGIYDEMIDNGDIIIKKPVEVQFEIGEINLIGKEMIIDGGEISTDNEYVAHANILSAKFNIEEAKLKVKSGEITFTKVTKEEYRIV